MRSTLTGVALIALTFSVASSAWAADGVLIVEKATSGGNSQTNQVQIEAQRMRVDTTTPAGEKQAFVFDGARQTISIVNFDKKIYSEMTKADVDRMGGQVNDAMARLQEQMKNMPPEQRAQMEAMMRGRGFPGAGRGAAAAQTEYRKTGTDKVGKWTCEKYEGYQNNQKVSELCTVSPQELGFMPSDFAVAAQMAEFFRKLVPQGAEAMFQVGNSQAQGFSGVPVRRIVTMGGRQMTTEVTDIRRQAFPESSFAVPAGFSKDAGPFGGGPR